MPAAARQPVPAATFASVGQLGLTPSQLSAASQAPAAARQAVPAALGSHAPVEGLQLLSTSQLPPQMTGAQRFIQKAMVKGWLSATATSSSVERSLALALF